MKIVKTNRDFHKKVSGVVALVTIMALMLTGTFAWYATSHAENIFTGEKSTEEIPPSILHDDFDPDTGQKEVYVENTGDPESIIYVRLKLNEFLDLKIKQRPEVIDEKDWITHKPIKGADNAYHHEDCENTNNADKKFHDYFTWYWGSDWSTGTEVKTQKWYLPAAKMTGEFAEYNKGAYVDDTTDYSTLTAAERDALGLKQTPLASISSIDYYLGMSAAEQTAYVGWIYDFNDGWAYWSQPLKGGEATGMLLKSVVTDKEKLKNNDYCYIIDVILDAVDKADLPMWIDHAPSIDENITALAEQASAEGQRVLSIIEGIEEKTAS